MKKRPIVPFDGKRHAANQADVSRHIIRFQARLVRADSASRMVTAAVEFVKSDLVQIAQTASFGEPQSAIGARRPILPGILIPGVSLITVEVPGVSSTEQLRSLGVSDKSVSMANGKMFLAIWVGRLINVCLDQNFESCSRWHRGLTGS